MLVEARLALVERASGITVGGTTVRSQSERMVGSVSKDYIDNFLQLTRQEVSGRIIEEASRFVRVGEDSLTLELRGRVACESGAAAVFSGTVSTDQPAYYDKDPVRLKVQATDSVRLSLFAIAANGEARLFFPNRYDTLNTIASGIAREIPRPGTSAYELVAELDPRFGQPQAEVIVAVFQARRGDPLFRAGDAFTRLFTFAEVNAILMRIPREERAEALVGYEIRARQ